MAERLRGRAGQRQRRRRLDAEPICRLCRKRGVIVPSVVPDHIEPLSQGGSDDDDNIQCLCEPCHSLKSAREDTAHEAAANYPTWLKPSAIPLTIVAGPPCSGKTTYIAQHRQLHDVVIDLDTIQMELDPTYQHWSGSLNPVLFNKAVRVRNALLGALSKQVSGSAWFIASAPTKAERDWWQSQLGGRVVLLHPGSNECKARAITRGTPRARAGVDAWERASRQPWLPPGTRPAPPTIGLDGWPIP